MRHVPRSEPVTPQRIERALAFVAYLVARDDAGLIYVPIMDRLERELVAARRAEAPRNRARRLLDLYTAPSGAHALIDRR